MEFIIHKEKSNKRISDIGHNQQEKSPKELEDISGDGGINLQDSIGSNGYIENLEDGDKWVEYGTNGDAEIDEVPGEFLRGNSEITFKDEIFGSNFLEALGMFFHFFKFISIDTF